MQLVDEQAAFSPRRSAIAIALAYAVVAGLWIILSGRALLWLFPHASTELLSWLEAGKGCLFVGVTTLMLYVLVVRRLRTLHKSQEALLQSELRYRRLIDTVREGVWTLDAQARTLFVNREMAVMLGYAPEELVSREAETLVDPASREAWRRLLRSPESRTSRDPDILLRRRDGSELWAIISVSCGDHSQLGAWLIMVTDVTARRLADDQFRRAQRLEAVGQLAGGVAHDFNNLLAIIMGYADAAVRHLSPNHLSREQLNEIQRAAERGADLIRCLLAFSRMQATEMRTVDVVPVLGEIMPMLRRLIAPVVRLLMDVAPQPMLIRAGAGQLEQIIMNLVQNAADAMPEGGTVRISARRQDVALEPELGVELRPDVYVQLEVLDDGSGMDRQTLALALEPFFTTKQEKGTGLGLSVVYGIVQECGGQIAIDSTPGAGTRVRIWLPMALVHTASHA